MQARTQKMSSMFVRLSSPLYTCTYTSSFATNSATSFICYREEKTRIVEEIKIENRKIWKERAREKQRSFFRSPSRVRPFCFYPMFYYGVALGATTTRSIVVTLSFSHHHQQQAVTATETASEKERKRESE